MNQISRGYNTESPDYRSGSWLIYFDTQTPVAKKPNEYGYVYHTFTNDKPIYQFELSYSPVKEKVEYLDLYTDYFYE
jgi:hypothetical protein